MRKFAGSLLVLVAAAACAPTGEGTGAPSETPLVSVTPSDASSSPSARQSTSPSAHPSGATSHPSRSGAPISKPSVVQPSYHSSQLGQHD